MKDKKIDDILRSTLCAADEPSDELNQKIIKKLKENNTMKPAYKNKFKVMAIAAVLVVAMSVTAFAAWRLLSPRDAADRLGNYSLAAAFEGKDAITVNESVTSGSYRFTFLGVVSGRNLSDFKSSAEEINPDRTYAALAIENKDGSPMPSSTDENYGSVPFFVSPLIRGLAPWQYNIASMGGGYSEFVQDGVLYRLIECDGIEMFADRGLYLAVSTTPFYDINAFDYNESTGEISVSNNFSGGNALFDLPVDPAKSNKDMAEKYLQNFNKQDDDSSSEDEFIEPEVIEVMPDSEKVMSFDEEGMAYYEYDGGKMVLQKDFLPENLNSETWITLSVSESDTNKTATQFKMDSDGSILARTAKIK